MKTVNRWSMLFGRACVDFIGETRLDLVFSLVFCFRGNDPSFFGQSHRVGVCVVFVISDSNL